MMKALLLFVVISSLVFNSECVGSMSPKQKGKNNNNNEPKPLVVAPASLSARGLAPKPKGKSMSSSSDEDEIDCDVPDYNSIPEAIDAAYIGQFVFVCPGSYVAPNPGVFNLNKQIVLSGWRKTPNLPLPILLSPVNITASKAVLQFFTISERQCGNSGFAITVRERDSVVIRRNEITALHDCGGIFLQGARWTEVYQNKITERITGVQLSGSNANSFRPGHGNEVEANILTGYPSTSLPSTGVQILIGRADGPEVQTLIASNYFTAWDYAGRFEAYTNGSAALFDIKNNVFENNMRGLFFGLGNHGHRVSRNRFNQTTTVSLAVTTQSLQLTGGVTDGILLLNNVIHRPVTAGSRDICIYNNPATLVVGLYMEGNTATTYYQDSSSANTIFLQYNNYTTTLNGPGLQC